MGVSLRLHRDLTLTLIHSILVFNLSAGRWRLQFLCCPTAIAASSSPFPCFARACSSPQLLPHRFSHHIIVYPRIS
jgi:hypothetical protein